MKQKLSQFTARFAQLKLARLNLKSGRRLVVGLLLLQLVVVAAVAWQIKLKAQHELETAQADLARRSFVPFEKRALLAISSGGIKLMQSSKATRSLVRFNDSYFAATEGGLVELSTEGKLKRHFTVLDGLPESDLTALARFGTQLFIGTRSQGLVALDGSRFTGYRWTDRKAQAVTALLEDRGRLLIGTFAGGLLEFDGKQFRELRADQRRIAAIEHLAADGDRLFVGTFNDGLWVNESAGEKGWRHFTIADGLESNRVVGVVTNGDQVMVATDFGVTLASATRLFGAPDVPTQRSFQPLVALPALSGIARYGDAILLCKDNGEIFRLALDAGKKSARLDQLFWQRPANGPAASGSGSLSSCQLNVVAGSGEQSLWLLAGDGIRRTGWQDDKLPISTKTSSVSGRLNLVSFGELSEAGGPISNLASALAFDDAGNLWVGSFRDGIDVFTRTGRRLTHLESETVREINSLVWDDSSKRMIAGTSQGLVSFNASMQPRVINVGDGLISNSVLHAAPIQTKSSASSANRTELVLATSRGLAFGQANQWRALTAVQGLPSNSVYAVLPHRDSIYAGTLSGLAEIKAGRVVRVFKDSNSKLAQNWVTALSAVGDRLFIGTYGGGVFELMPSGELAGFSAEIGKQTVNPNAMTSDGRRLYVGTLDGAWVLELTSQKWTRLKAELPSTTVLSVASDGENAYFGTTSGIARIRLDYLRPVA